MDLALAQTTASNSGANQNDSLLGLVADSAGSIQPCRSLDALEYWLLAPTRHSGDDVPRRKIRLRLLPDFANVLMQTHGLTSSGQPTLIPFKSLLASAEVVIEQHVDIDLVERDSLRGHEDVIPANLDERIKKLLDRGFYKPIIVDETTMVILDGHHKWTAAGVLELDKVPVVRIDYLGDASVVVDVWPGCGRDSVTKHEVIEMGLSGEVFPPKTSRHSFGFELPEIQIPLDTLKT